jgi:hypothetical protein
MNAPKAQQIGEAIAPEASTSELQHILSPEEW